MQAWQIRRVANWLNGSTAFGFAVARLGRASVQPGARGLHLASDYQLGFPFARAFTVGDVVITRRDAQWLVSRPRLLAHEERHSWQYVACLGLPFIPLYVAATAWSLWRTGDRGAGNVFEQLAGLADGGYHGPTADEITAVRRRRRLSRAGG